MINHGSGIDLMKGSDKLLHLDVGQAADVHRELGRECVRRARVWPAQRRGKSIRGRSLICGDETQDPFAGGNIVPDVNYPELVVLRKTVSFA